MIAATDELQMVYYATLKFNYEGTLQLNISVWLIIYKIPTIINLYKIITAVEKLL